MFKFAVRSVPEVIDHALTNAGLTKEDVDWLVMHQANQRILDAAANRLGLPTDRVVSNLAGEGRAGKERRRALMRVCMTGWGRSRERVHCMRCPNAQSTATPAPPPSPWRWMRPCGEGASSRATW